MTIWTVTLLICWLNGQDVTCHVWTGGAWAGEPWRTHAACFQATNAMMRRSDAIWFRARCTPAIAS